MSVNPELVLMDVANAANLQNLDTAKIRINDEFIVVGSNSVFEHETSKVDKSFGQTYHVRFGRADYHGDMPAHEIFKLILGLKDVVKDLIDAQKKIHEVSIVFRRHYDNSHQCYVLEKTTKRLKRMDVDTFIDQVGFSFYSQKPQVIQ